MKSDPKVLNGINTSILRNRATGSELFPNFNFTDMSEEHSNYGIEIIESAILSGLEGDCSW